MTIEFLLINKDPVLPFADFSLRPGEYVVGRSSDADVPVYDLTISRPHAKLLVTEESISIADLGSRNGTFVNGAQVQTGTALAGSEIRFGRVSFLVGVRPVGDPAGSIFDVDTVRHSFKAGAEITPEYRRILTSAQLRVLGFLLEGKSEKDIARELQISPHTVHNHVREIYQALDVHSRAQLLAKFISSKPGNSDTPPTLA